MYTYNTTTQHNTTTQQHPNPNRALSRKQAAAYFGISESFLKQLDLSGRGPRAYRLGRRWLYRTADLDQFLERHVAEPSQGGRAAP